MSGPSVSLFPTLGSPRVFAMPPGADFAHSLVQGLHRRTAKDDPAALGRVELYVNSARMMSEVQQAFHDGPATFLPKIKLITQFGEDYGGLGHAAPALRRRLELRSLVAKLVQAEPRLAPTSSVPDLTDTLASLLEEMEDEGVPPRTVADLDTGDQSGHWQQAQKFLSILAQFADADREEAPSPARLLRERAKMVIEHWAKAPPAHPIIVAGSTGSRGTTSMIMRAVARLPQGALILPGFDWHQPHIWARLTDGIGSHDHPQYRFADLLARLNMTADDVHDWGALISNAQAARNKLISLSLRPAPVTNEWRNTEETFTDFSLACSGMSLAIADTPLHEAQTIALAMRDALENGRRVALITPDQNLTRLVEAALARWKIEPDASIGQRLSHAPSGVLMRLVLRGVAEGATAADQIALLKHPLVARGGDRASHIDFTRRLELWSRRTRLATIGPDDLDYWSKGLPADLAEKASVWVTFVAQVLYSWGPAGGQSLGQFLAWHRQVTERLVSGWDGADAEELYAKPSGAALHEFLGELAAEADLGGRMKRAEYAVLLENFLSKIEARDPLSAREDVKIWGTLEARVQSADLVILGGLNQGIWPEEPGADPWLNRALRLQAGLRLPDRAIGLSAHDYQQAIAAKNVLLTRSLRDEEADTVPSRWLSRFCNLMEGLSDNTNADLQGMIARGNDWAELARQIDAPRVSVLPAPRPAPIPPAKTLPKRLSVTEIEKLIRDPYAIYARHVLRLRPLDPCVAVPDARLRGIAVHQVFEDAIAMIDFSRVRDELAGEFRNLSADVLRRAVPSKDAQILWQSYIDPLVDPFTKDEVERQSTAKVRGLEVRGTLKLPEIGFELIAKADRIDQSSDGAIIYDYKSRKPNGTDIAHFDKQLILEALILEAGGFQDLPSMTVDKVAHIEFANEAKTTPVKQANEALSTERDHLVRLLSAYLIDGQGFASKRISKDAKYAGDYDQLARFGEWDETAVFSRIRVT